MRGPLWVASTLLLTACAAPATRPSGGRAASGAQQYRPLPNVPDFATKPYAPFSRAAAVAIALREWRLFGQPVDDDPPGTRTPPPPDLKPERIEGLWQRVGEYWWIGLDPTRLEAAWTGKHDAFGTVFDPSDDSSYAWSAAFVSYVMRTAGAGERFLYSPSHNTYIDAAARHAPGLAVDAQPLDVYAPQPGDLICASRTARPLRFSDLPAGAFASHCDIVIDRTPGSLTVLGGNVDDAVTMKHVPVTADGRLSDGGRLLDGRYDWFVVLRVAYDV